MSIPSTKLPDWGGALGRIAQAIGALARAHENTTSSDDRLSVQEGGGGEKILGLNLDDDGGDSGIGDLPGGEIAVVTDVNGSFSVSGSTLTLTLNVARVKIVLDPDGTLRTESTTNLSHTISITGGACSSGS